MSQPASQSHRDYLAEAIAFMAKTDALPTDDAAAQLLSETIMAQDNECRGIWIAALIAEVASRPGRKFPTRPTAGKPDA